MLSRSRDGATPVAGTISHISIFGRLKPGVTPQQATDSLNALALQMAKEDKKDDGLTLRLRQPGPAGE